MTDKQLVPTIEFATRPIIVDGEKLTTSELAWLGRSIIVALSEGEKIDKEFVKNFIKIRILIYTNPENVDFGRYENDR